MRERRFLPSGHRRVELADQLEQRAVLGVVDPEVLRDRMEVEADQAKLANGPLPLPLAPRYKLQ